MSDVKIVFDGARMQELLRSLGKVGDPLAGVYNTLLEQARKKFPEDRLIGTLTPVGEDMHPRVLQALAGQLRLVLGNS